MLINIMVPEILVLLSPHIPQLRDSQKLQIITNTVAKYTQRRFGRVGDHGMYRVV